MTLSVGIVGAGTRVREIYLPVLRALPELFTVVGIAGRSRASVDRLAAEIGVSAHDSVSSLCVATNPKLVIVAVAAQANAAVAMDAVRQGPALLLETPLALNPSDGRALVRAAVTAGRTVGVCEQKPFLPAECFKRLIIEAGVLGPVGVVENDFRALGYHAVAQLRRYLPADSVPMWVQSIRAVSPRAAFVDRDGAAHAAGREDWKMASVRFSGGAVAVHHFSTAFKKAPYRIGASLRVYGSAGSIVGDEIAMCDRGGETVRISVQTEQRHAIERMTARLPDGRVVDWTSPFAGASLSDDQTAVAQHLAAMHRSIDSGGQPLYNLHQALLDVDIVHAMDRSERRGGGPVLLNHRCAHPDCRPLSAMARTKARAAAMVRSASANAWFDGLRSRIRSAPVSPRSES